MFGLSGEHILILGVIVLVFGPRKLPELGKGLGESIRNFRSSLSGEQKSKEGAQS